MSKLRNACNAAVRACLRWQRRHRPRLSILYDLSGDAIRRSSPGWL